MADKTGYQLTNSKVRHAHVVLRYTKTCTIRNVLIQ